MAIFDQLSGLLGNVLGGNLSEQETHAHYDQIAQAVPQDQLGAAIGPAMNGLGNQEVLQRVTNSANQMTPQQKGGLVGTLLGALGKSGGGVGSILGQLGIDPSVASNPQNASADDVGKIAAHAQATNPGIFQEGMSFYSAHPTLVKALGTVVIAQVARHLANPQA